MAWLRLLPVALSLLVLAAHFLRAGQSLPLALVVALLVLLFARQPWVPRVLQVALLLGAAEWVRTLAAIAARRLRDGEPVARMAVILGAVALATAVSALVFRSPSVRRWYGAGER